MRLIFYLFVTLNLLACLVSRSFGDEESCTECSYPVQIDGQFTHQENRATIVVTNGNEAAYNEEISGTNFIISISHLPAGKYSIVIGEAETAYQKPGERLFDVVSGNTILAANYDIIANAGGAAKVCFITGTVAHSDDSIHGPLSVAFNGRKNEAKFSTLEVRDGSGAALVSIKASDLMDAFTAAASQPPAVTGPVIWKEPAQTMGARVNDLILRMSLAEKVQQIRNAAPAIPRLGIPAYNYWNEALHGVANAGVATVFPQAIGMAATWDPLLIHSEADVISTEGRAKYNDYTCQHGGDSKGRYGLTFWSPNVNIFRDPRWGRGQETYGEDPFLTAEMAVAFIHGLQGEDPKYVKAMACAKHFAVHSGPESERHRFDVSPPERDFYETYLPQFEAAVREGHVGGVMGAYNSVYGKPACANPLLLEDILRNRWGFEGYVVSDCGAIHDIWANHHFVATQEEAAAMAIKAGCDICCGRDNNSLIKAVQKGLVTEQEIDHALSYALQTRFRLGMFDPPELIPWSKLTLADNDTPGHRALALKVAEESVVLLVKMTGLLPLDRSKIKRIAIIGANAESVSALVGNYNGTPSAPVTIADGIKAIAGPGIKVTCQTNCPLASGLHGSNKSDFNMLDDAYKDAKAADVVIYVGGINAQLEGEEMKSTNSLIGFNAGDRTRIEPPEVQEISVKRAVPPAANQSCL